MRDGKYQSNNNMRWPCPSCTSTISSLCLKYAQAIENFFGVKGILTRGNMHCGKQSHKANEANPLVVHNETRTRLTELNRLDLKLYHEISDCVADWSYEQIPQWDGNRFALDYSSPSRVRRVRWS